MFAFRYCGPGLIPTLAVGIFLHLVTFGGQYVGSTAGFWASRWNCPGITAWFRADSETKFFISMETCSRDRYLYVTHFHCHTVEAGFNTDAVKCFSIEPATWVRFSAGSGWKIFRFTT